MKELNNFKYLRDMKSSWALITGASSGFGVNYAENLASLGINLVITARRETRLLDLKLRLESEFGIQVKVMVLDLATAGAVNGLMEEISSSGIQVDILINNAGYGIHGEFANTPLENTMAMLQVNIMALTELTKGFADQMKQRGKGYILLISSIGAYLPTPTYAAYAASKAFVLNFGEALNFEMKKYNVKVSVLSPGVTQTEFLQVSGQKPTFYQRLAMMKSQPVALTGLVNMFKGTPSIVPGLMNKLTIFSRRLMGRTLQTKVAYLTMKSN